MAQPKTGRKDVSDQSVIQAVLPSAGNGPKRLARLMRVPIETARLWYYKSLSSYRRAEVALILLQEFDKETAGRPEIRRRLCVMAGLVNEVEILAMPNSAAGESFIADAIDWVADGVGAASDKLGATAARRIAEK
jgi:hypothetical protein